MKDTNTKSIGNYQILDKDYCWGYMRLRCNDYAAYDNTAFYQWVVAVDQNQEKKVILQILDPDSSTKEVEATSFYFG